MSLGWRIVVGFRFRYYDEMFGVPVKLFIYSYYKGKSDFLGCCLDSISGLLGFLGLLFGFRRFLLFLFVYTLLSFFIGLDSILIELDSSCYKDLSST
jgi:hypothetical protein